MFPIAVGQLMLPAGEVVGSDRGWFDPLVPDMPGIPPPVFPLLLEGEVIGGIVPLVAALMPGMEEVEVLVADPLDPIAGIVEEPPTVPLVPMFGIVLGD